MRSGGVPGALGRGLGDTLAHKAAPGMKSIEKRYKSYPPRGASELLTWISGEPLTWIFIVFGWSWAQGNRKIDFL